MCVQGKFFPYLSPNPNPNPNPKGSSRLSIIIYCKVCTHFLLNSCIADLLSRETGMNFVNSSLTFNL